MPQMEESDLLEIACEQAADYPTGKTYLADDIPPTVRDSHRRRLYDDRDLLFDDSHPLLVFMEKMRRDSSECLNIAVS